jgi:hypothetical protein
MSVWKKLENSLDVFLPSTLAASLTFDYSVSLKVGIIPYTESNPLINFFVDRFGPIPGTFLSGLCQTGIYAGICYGLYKTSKFLFRKFWCEELIEKYPILNKLGSYAMMISASVMHLSASLPEII